MALFCVRVDPNFKGLLYPEKHTWSNKSSLPELKWLENMEIYPYTLTKLICIFSPETVAEIWGLEFHFSKWHWISGSRTPLFGRTTQND